MRIGYYDDDGYFTPVPACRRAVSVAVETLKQRGHKVCDKLIMMWDLTEILENLLFYRLINSM